MSGFSRNRRSHDHGQLLGNRELNQNLLVTFGLHAGQLRLGSACSASIANERPNWHPNNRNPARLNRIALAPVN
jgi:hypothetical protein